MNPPMSAPPPPPAGAPPLFLCWFVVPLDSASMTPSNTPRGSNRAMIPSNRSSARSDAMSSSPRTFA
eukprot:30962-Pelagococcus_subviridis.AAC.3